MPKALDEYVSQQDRANGDIADVGRIIEKHRQQVYRLMRRFGAERNDE
ncbi:MAG: hypothetical protein HY791_14380 [Deltaproteobacteria bacterium]|nr:hypothetical protein [Deltaproteobacteria bacterium]